ncbi:hypothetical protein RCR19_41745 [Streptomyces sp. WAC07094]|uniref:hypothetical protein n=1 Tax=unclassified Streptomyces TaxID=2593676 RepID=UPI002EC00537|nr:hypothetical protein [Streptomyces sp. WAC07094]
MKRRSLTAVLIVSVALAASACDSSAPATPGPADKPSAAASNPAALASGDRSPVPTPTPTGTAGGAAARGADADPCGVLKPGEVTPVIEENDGGRPSPVSKNACMWLTSAGGPGMTVLLGPSGSAASFASDSEFNEPGPDGIRFDPFDTGLRAHFVAADRSCVIEVISGSRGKPERSTLVRLAGLVRGRTRGNT